MRSNRVSIVVEVGLSVALAAVLSLLKITLPWNFAGGSVSLAMLPIFVLAVRRGVGPGVVGGMLFGGVDYMLEPWFVHPVQVVLDYPVAFGLCGLAGLLRPAVRRSGWTGARAALMTAMAAVVGGIGRLGASFLSGVVFFGQNAGPGQPVWLYSLVYNGSYLLPSIVSCAVAAAIVVPALGKAVPVGMKTARP